jgi:Zn-finger nucleic acid-binding protein
MAAFELEGVEVDRCLLCGGTWLDAGELEILGQRDGTPPGTLSAAIERARGARHGDRRCPRCGGRLRVVEADGVELDRCARGDGLWFDRGELLALIGREREGEAGAAARFFRDFFAADLKKREA